MNPARIRELAYLSVALLVACSGSPSKSTSPGPDAGAFTVAACKADTCGTEAAKCSWGTAEPKYTGCLADCENLGVVDRVCPEQVSALYACAAKGTKVDCTTGKGTGCSAEEQALVACATFDAGN
jgi:hypothetical protein